MKIVARICHTPKKSLHGCHTVVGNLRQQIEMKINREQKYISFKEQPQVAF